MRIQQVAAEYGAWDAERRRRTQRAMARAAAALGGSRAALGEVKQRLKRVVHGKMEAAAFVDACLSPRFFGADDDALVELLGTLPEEHAELRDGLLELIEGRRVY